MSGQAVSPLTGVMMSLINGATKIDKNDAKVDLKAKALSAAANAAGKFGVSTFESQTGIRFDPSPAYLFYVEITGVIVGLFTSCSGLGVSRQVETIGEGGVNDRNYALPGKVSYSNITLSRGLTISRELWNWFRNGLYDFQVKKLNLSIVQGASGQDLISAVTSSGNYGTVKRWNVENAYPVSWKLSELSTSNVNAVAIETLVLAHDGLSLSSVMGTPMSIMGALT